MVDFAHTSPDIYDDRDRGASELAAYDLGLAGDYERHGLLIVETGESCRPQGTLVLSSVAKCHGCQQEVPFDVEVWLTVSGGGGGSECQCTGCGSRISIMQSYGTPPDESWRGMLLMASPITELMGRPLSPLRLFYRSHTIINA